MKVSLVSHPRLSHALQRVGGWGRSWVWSDVVAPMVVVRLCLLVAGWLSQDIVPNPAYPAPGVPERGWHYTGSRLLDMWARWDSGWYFGIIRAGYDVNDPGAPNNFAFFPLYPYLIKLLLLPLPERLQTTQRVLIIGLLVSNAFLIGALVLLHKLITDSLGDRELARRAVLYILLFPTGFFLFCFYTESTFLFFSVWAFYAANRKAWGTACFSGGLLSLTRPLGVLVFVPLLWLYFEPVGWKLPRVRKDILWFLLIPAGLLSFLLYAYAQTGDFLAPMHAQSSWGKTFAMPWTTLFNPYGGSKYVTRVEQVLAVVFIALSFFCLFKLPSRAYGIYSFLLILPPLTTGTLLSTSRYYVVIFPAFIALALLGRRAGVDNFLRIAMLALQIAFMVAWSRFYWVA